MGLVHARGAARVPGPAGYAGGRTMRTRVLPQRAVAYLVDSFFVFLLWIPIFLRESSLHQETSEEVARQVNVSAEALAIGGWLTVLTISWLLWPLVSVPYYAVQEGLLGGRTLGKRITGVKVVRGHRTAHP